MAGVLFCNNKRSGYGSTRNTAPLRLINKPHRSGQSGVHAKGESLPSQHSGSGNSESLRNENWRSRCSDDAHDEMKLNMESPTRETTSQQHSQPYLPSILDLLPAESLPVDNHDDSVNLKVTKSERSNGAHNYNILHGKDWEPYSYLDEKSIDKDHFFDVLNHSKLSDYNMGNTLHLFEVASAENHATTKRKCQLHQVHPTYQALNDHVDQLLSGVERLALDDGTGKKIGSTRSILNFGPGGPRDYRFCRQFDVMGTPAFQKQLDQHVARSQRINSKDSGLSSSVESYDDFDRAVKAGTHIERDTSTQQTAALAEKAIAFQKIIQKLNRAPKHKTENRQSGDSEYEADALGPMKPEHVASDTMFRVEQRRPIQGAGRRDKTESDFAVGYWTVSEAQRRSDRTSDSGMYDGHEKDNSLNPKAREFLSFVNKESGLLTYGRKTLLDSSDCSNREQEESSDSASLNWFPGDAGLLSTQDGSMCHPGDDISRVYPVPLRLRALPPQLSKVSPCAMNLVPISSFPPDTYKMMSSQTAGWPTYPFPSPNLLGVFGAPDARQIDQYTYKDNIFNATSAIPVQDQMTTPLASKLPITPATSTNSIPRPVPKPKHPNSKDQQEYEAWVEWRKANEPGYALACKLRQQRRAQRNNTQKKKQG